MDKIQGLTPAKTRDTKPSSLQGYIMEGHLRQITAGCIVWLPAKAHILPGAEVDQHLNEGAFDHPAILVSVPCPLKYNSTVEFAIVTSFKGRTLHQANKLNHRSDTLRVRTKIHPHAKVDLNLKNKKGMSRKYSFVYMRKYKIELRTLGLYERQVGELCLTSQSLKKLVEAISKKQRGKSQRPKASAQGNSKNKVRHKSPASEVRQSKGNEAIHKMKPSPHHHTVLPVRPPKDPKPRPAATMSKPRH